MNLLSKEVVHFLMWRHHEMSVWRHSHRLVFVTFSFSASRSVVFFNSYFLKHRWKAVPYHVRGDPCCFHVRVTHLYTCLWFELKIFFSKSKQPMYVVIFTAKKHGWKYQLMKVMDKGAQERCCSTSSAFIKREKHLALYLEIIWCQTAHVL